MSKWMVWLLVTGVAAGCGVPDSLKHLPERDQQRWMRCEDKVYDSQCGWGDEAGMAQHALCRRDLRKGYAKATNAWERRNWLLKHGCPSSLAGPDEPKPAAKPAPTRKSRKSKEGESCTKTADCSPPLRCVQQSCVMPHEAQPASQPTTLPASQPTTRPAS